MIVGKKELAANADRCTGSGYTGAVAQIFCPEIQESFYPFSYGEVFFFVTGWQGRLRLFAGRSCYVRGYCRFSGEGLLSGRELDGRPYLSFGCPFGVQDTEQEGGMWMICAGKRYAFPV